MRSRVLAPAFTAITGIKVKHEIIGEGDVVAKLERQMQSGENMYDAYVNDSDLIGTHWRYQQVRNLTDWMTGDGKAVTSPTLDMADFVGASFTTAPDGKLYQLPDQQFANLYWFRYDWFADPKNKADFKAKYGYDLGVPVNWSAYEDIAEFFTGRTIDGKKVYGHMDYGKKDPSLGWRFTDSWLSMAGNGDKTNGHPNGFPVDEWGIRVDEQSRPVGSCVARGGDTNGPASVYAIAKYLDWMKIRAARSRRHELLGVRPDPGAGRDRAADVLVHHLHRRHGERGPAGAQRRWHAEMAHGPVAARRLLGRGPEARLPGRRLVDADDLDADRPRAGRLALRAVRHVQDGGREEEPCRPHLHS